MENMIKINCNVIMYFIISNQEELKKRLNIEKANSEMNDNCKFRYVSFSCARKLLCIAYLGNIDVEFKIINSLIFFFITSPKL